MEYTCYYNTELYLLHTIELIDLTFTYGMDSYFWYSFFTLEPKKYERAKCCPYTGIWI